MSILLKLKDAFPNASADFFRRVESIGSPRFMLAGDIGNWIDLRKQINASTGKINSYRDIQRICKAMDSTVPSLGTLRNYLGDGGTARYAQSKGEWLSWFEDFGHITEFFKDELRDLTTPEEWETFRAIYLMFLGY